MENLCDPRNSTESMIISVVDYSLAVSLEQLLAERTYCYQTARQINEQRVILSRALRTQKSLTGFHQILHHDLEDLTQQLQCVTTQARRLTLQIIFQQSDLQL